MANFDAQITELVGGTIDQTACDQWAVDGIREIIQKRNGWKNSED